MLVVTEYLFFGIIGAALIALIYFLFTLSVFIQTKEAVLRSEQRKALIDIQIQTGERPHSMEERIKITNDFLDMIDDTVQTQIAFLVNSLVVIEQPYDLKNAKDDVERISMVVKESIKGEIYITPDLLVTDAYIFDYIVSLVTSTLLRIVREHNASYRMNG